MTNTNLAEEHVVKPPTPPAMPAAVERKTSETKSYEPKAQKSVLSTQDMKELDSLFSQQDINYKTSYDLAQMSQEVFFRCIVPVGQLINVILFSRNRMIFSLTN